MLPHAQARSAPLSRFNPRPTVRSGDALNENYINTPGTRFNPRPTVRSGDAGGWMVSSNGRLVSIRARP